MRASLHQPAPVVGTDTHRFKVPKDWQINCLAQVVPPLQTLGAPGLMGANQPSTGDVPTTRQHRQLTGDATARLRVNWEGASEQWGARTTRGPAHRPVLRHQCRRPRPSLHRRGQCARSSFPHRLSTRQPGARYRLRLRSRPPSPRRRPLPRPRHRCNPRNAPPTGGITCQSFRSLAAVSCGW
jgi:hypothetical protein